MADDLEGDDIWGDAGAAAAPAPAADASGDAAAAPAVDTSAAAPQADQEDEETRHMTVGELRQRIHLLNNDVRIMKSDVQRITHESRGQRDRIRENQEKVKLNKQLPYLVANVVEILEPDAEDGKSNEYIYILYICIIILVAFVWSHVLDVPTLT
jgi:ATP-dependent 26S proteasome regulatory subunit